ncbi:MAG: VTT domain-containing protein [Gammaproteobacteria bacterium]|nr:VTT domain-containing protein [Gammaproteobacteria bacterium]
MNLERLARIVFLFVLIAGIVAAFMYRDRLNLVTLDIAVKEAGLLAPLMFMLIYAIATVLFLPGSILTLAGGALFGPIAGTFYNLTGATLCAALAFLVARYLASDWVARKAGGKIKQLIDGVETEGWRFVAFTRLVPLFPFFILNYALGLTRIRFWHYVLASYVFMLPGAFAFTYFGYAGREVAAGNQGMVQKILLALALIAALIFLPRFIKHLRKPKQTIVPAAILNVTELKQRLDGGEDIFLLDVRGPDEYHGPLGHIRGSKQIALADLDQHLHEIRQLASKPIAVLCRTDRRSAKAVEQLHQAGLRELLLVRGGMTAWNQEGFPIER